MSNKILSVIIAAVALLAVAAGVIRIAGVDLADYFQRHPNAAIPVTGGVAMDYFQRHPEVIQSNASVELLDYSLRHPATAIERYFPGKELDDLVIADVAIDRRFPGKEKDDLSVNELPLVWHTPAYQGYTPWDQTDSRSSNPDGIWHTPAYQGYTPYSNDTGASDYIDRHADLLEPGNAVDVFDWFQRHPESLAKTMNAVDYTGMTGTYLPGMHGLASTHVGEVNDFARMTGTYLPGLQGLASARASEANDYIERHPELLKSKSTADMSDWFQRHPNSINR